VIAVPYIFMTVFAVFTAFSRRVVSLATWINSHNPQPLEFDEETMAMQFRVLGLIATVGAAVIAVIVTARSVMG
jgi:hypothetical protein